MNSIQALKSELNSQIVELSNIENRKISDKCIYVGSGDSYVAGLFTEYLTDRKCRCYSPSDLSNSRLPRDWTYCFVSVTGKTRANIEVAERASQMGAKTVAITFNENSKLAQVCDKTVLPKIERPNVSTTGFGSFVPNVVTCLQVAGITVPKKFDWWYKNALKLSQNLFESMILPDDTVFILGNNTLYPLAIYASFQMAEFFGNTAVAHKLEEFCHSPIFGLKKTHHVWVLGQKEDHVSKRIGKLEGPQISYFELYSKDINSQIFESIFFVQNLILLMAEKYGYTELKYLMTKDVLKASSDIIYFK
jgi:fructoselysine-6-P-deglycase FrlB-like protein